jgi:aromatic-amino-acid transaminase
MFESLADQSPDTLLSLITAFAADERPEKIDLGVGVYRDSEGRTPVMRAVKAAELHLLETQETKKYLGTEGDRVFIELSKQMIFGKQFSRHVVGIQTPGGSGALRLGSELVVKSDAGAQVWLGTPGWPNHGPIFASVMLKVKPYACIDLATQKIDFNSVVEALSKAKKGDIVLLQGCCQNPSGIDFTIDQWKFIANLLAVQQLVPFIDLAYQGFGSGLEQDVWATRLILEAVDEALIAYSFSKNFGLYRERVGALFVVARNTHDALKSHSNLSKLARVNWSMPPDHGAAIVRTILENPSLTESWQTELTDMRLRVIRIREALAKATPELSFISKQSGMFSNLSIDRKSIESLRVHHGIYMSESGRINLAGMQLNDISAIVTALDNTL